MLFQTLGSASDSPSPWATAGCQSQSAPLCLMTFSETPKTSLPLCTPGLKCRGIHIPRSSPHSRLTIIGAENPSSLTPQGDNSEVGVLHHFPATYSGNTPLFGCLPFPASLPYCPTKLRCHLISHLW